MGRATQGVRLINIQESDEIAAVTKVDHEDEEVSNVNPTESSNSENSSENGPAASENTPTDDNA